MYISLDKFCVNLKIESHSLDISFHFTEIMEVFNLFDNKGDGKIAAYQLGDCLRSLGQNPTESEIRKCGFANTPGKYRLPIHQISTCTVKIR